PLSSQKRSGSFTGTGVVIGRYTNLRWTPEVWSLGLQIVLDVIITMHCGVQSKRAPILISPRIRSPEIIALSTSSFPVGCPPQEGGGTPPRRGASKMLVLTPYGTLPEGVRQGVSNLGPKGASLYRQAY